MPYETFHVGTQRDIGFFVELVEESHFRETVASWIDTALCRWPGMNHRFNWQFVLCNLLDNWAHKKEKSLMTLPITKEQANILRPGGFDFLTPESEPDKL